MTLLPVLFNCGPYINLTSTGNEVWGAVEARGLKQTNKKPGYQPSHLGKSTSLYLSLLIWKFRIIIKCRSQDWKDEILYLHHLVPPCTTQVLYHAVSPCTLYDSTMPSRRVWQPSCPALVLASWHLEPIMLSLSDLIVSYNICFSLEDSAI